MPGGGSWGCISIRSWITEFVKFVCRNIMKYCLRECQVFTTQTFQVWKQCLITEPRSYGASMYFLLMIFRCIYIYISPHISILLNCAELGTESFVCHIDCYDCYDDYRHFISCWFNLIHDFQQAKQQQKRFEVSFSSPALTLDSSTLLEWLSSWASSSWGSIIWQDTRKGLIYCSSRMF